MSKALLLLSGGIDSPVAGYLMQKQGLEVIAVHFSLEPFTDNAPEIKSKRLAKKIDINKFITVTIGNEEAIIRKNCKDRFFYVLTRRLMLRIAEIIAKEEGCEYLITGDSLGQVGSQTLENMTVISQAINMVILRPLLTNTKNETIAIARNINTYQDSIGPEMCSVLGPKHPATKSRLEIIEHEETKFKVNDLIGSALKTERIELLTE